MVINISEVVSMCLYGTHKIVKVINPNQNKNHVVVDACIAGEIQLLNNHGIITLGCCCGHGKAGQITVFDNGYDKWKVYEEPPHTLIDKRSVDNAKKLGYRPYPFYYSNGENNDVWKMQLQSGCLTEHECKEWHLKNNIEFKAHLGVIA
jgi:hypothetical protein